MGIPLKEMKIMNKRITIRVSDEMYKELHSASNFTEVNKAELIRLIVGQYLLRINEIFGSEELEPAQ